VSRGVAWADDYVGFALEHEHGHGHEHVKSAARGRCWDREGGEGEGRSGMSNAEGPENQDRSLDSILLSCTVSWQMLKIVCGPGCKGEGVGRKMSVQGLGT